MIRSHPLLIECYVRDCLKKGTSDTGGGDGGLPGLL